MDTPRQHEKTLPVTADANGAEEDTVKIPTKEVLTGWKASMAASESVWKSLISRNVAMIIFTVIFLMQGVVLGCMAYAANKEQLAQLRSVTRATLVAYLSNPARAPDKKALPIARPVLAKLADGVFIQGIAIYGLDHSLVEAAGVTPFLQPTAEGARSSRADDYYEVLFVPEEIHSPYSIVARVGAAAAYTNVMDDLRRAGLLLFILSVAVTAVLMVILNRRLLEPLLVLRNNLLSASRNPEKPEIQRLKVEQRDELGSAVRIASDMIRQNTFNLKRLRAHAEDKIRRLAYFDMLTGLPNRGYFLETLNDNIKHKVLEEDGRLAVLSVDIDHFKEINDIMGHEIGDKLLEAFAKRLVNALPEDAIASRVSADEFTVMVPLKPEHTNASAFVDKIIASLISPITVLQEHFQVRVSIGVTHCPEDGVDGRQILKNADIALNRAKEEGRDTVRYYSQDFDHSNRQRFQMLLDLRAGVSKEQLSLHYHPQFDLKTGQLIAAEALLRWWKPDDSKEGGRFISPAEFVPVAEKSGLIVPIGEYVLRTACKTNKMWQDRGLPPIRMAVNISGVQFHRCDIVGLVDSALKETGLEPQWLELEVTESVFMENMQTTVETLNRLHGLGVELAVDDFGTGYSSLNYLRQFPIDRLKIDQSFIRNALVNKDDQVVIRTIIDLGHSLGLKVIAEGVETNDHENFLRGAGCDESQGFKYTKPIPTDKFWEFFIAHQRALAKAAKLAVVSDKMPAN